MRIPDGAERLMAYSEIGKVINEAKAGMFAVVRGIHDENTLVVTMGNHIFELTITGIDGIEVANEVVTCARCKLFTVPSPLDHVGEALMTAHISVCKSERAEGRS